MGSALEAVRLSLVLLSVLATWAFWAAIFAGVGLCALRSCGFRRVRGDRALMAFWIGFALTIGGLQLWHFALPVSGIPLVVLAPLAAFGLLASRAELARWLRTLRAKPMLLVVVGLAVLWCADRAIGPGNAHDSGVYHFAGVRWNREHPIVPGLGNLLIQLGYNNASLLYTALLGSGPWAGRGHHLANGLLLSVLFVQVVGGSARLLRGGSLHPRASLYSLALLPVVVMLAVGKDASSPKTDLALSALLFVATGRLLVLASSRRARSPARTLDFLFVTLLAAAAVCVKLTGAGVALALWLAALAAWWGRGDRRRGDARRLVLAVLASAALVGPALARGVVLSGYPLPPAVILPANVDWRVPREVMSAGQEEVREFGRLRLAAFLHHRLSRSPSTQPLADLMGMPEDVDAALRSWAWLRPWLFSLALYSPIEILAPFVVLVLAGVLVLWNRSERPPATALLALAPGLAGVAFWFATAPEPRFGYASMWILAASSLALGAPERTEAVKRLARWAVVAAACIAATALIHRALANRMQAEMGVSGRVPFYLAGEDRGFHPIPSAALERFTTDEGLELWRPVNRSMSLCWDAPLPCAPDPHPNLDLRRAGEPGSGFRIRLR